MEAAMTAAPTAATGDMSAMGTATAHPHATATATATHVTATMAPSAHMRAATASMALCEAWRGSDHRECYRQ